MCQWQLCSALKTLKSKHQWVDEWQVHLLSCPGQLKIMACQPLVTGETSKMSLWGCCTNHIKKVIAYVFFSVTTRRVVITLTRWVFGNDQLSSNSSWLFLHRTRIADCPRRSQRGNRYIQIYFKCRQWKVSNKLKASELWCIPHICHFFTRAKFLENKIYTEKNA